MVSMSLMHDNPNVGGGCSGIDSSTPTATLTPAPRVESICHPRCRRSLPKRQQGGCQKKRREECLRFPTSVKPWTRPAKGRRARISVGIGFTMRLTDPHLGQPRAKDQLTLPKRHDS
ncbi:hypothetical protein BHE74_00040975 [Ensete ventricosum]|nr:hypothetical protein BHE74_00040975 [Ensete ventricosum]RZS19818.1 hypothetical protein BHM03_00052270 [Ensete ventricosum]